MMRLSIMLSSTIYGGVPMSEWRNLLNNGNDNFHNGKLQEAEYCYKEAAFHLDFLWSANTTKVPLLMAWICTYHNLASLFEAKNNPDLSLQYLLIPHKRMLLECNSDDCCDDTKLITHNALKITFMPILMFSKRHPICETCLESLSEFKADLNLNQPITH